MNSKDWHNQFSELVDGVISSIDNNTDNVTGADIGLILLVAEDYIDNPENAGRDIRAIETAEKILDLKYNKEDLSWFDLYQLVFETNANAGHAWNSEADDLEADIDEVYDDRSAQCSHTSEFQRSVRQLFEAVQSESAEELMSVAPYADDEVEDGDRAFKFGLSTKNSSMFGSVEIPNNLSRMQAGSELVDCFKGLSDDDLRWIVNTLKVWIEPYARAEATLTNRNVSQDELREFMMDEETPAERYW